MAIDVEAYLRRRYESEIADVNIVEKEDLHLVRHYSFSIISLSLSSIVLLMSLLVRKLLQLIYLWFHKVFMIALFTYLQKNHLSGLRKSYLKISFDTVQQLMYVKNDLLHVVEKNQAQLDAADAYESILTGKRYAF